MDMTSLFTDITLQYIYCRIIIYMTAVGRECYAAIHHISFNAAPFITAVTFIKI